jgi:hypothetical protein
MPIAEFENLNYRNKTTVHFCDYIVYATKKNKGINMSYF